MNIQIFPSAADANRGATDWLARKLISPGTRNVMLAGGNTPLTLYRELANRKLPLSHLHVFALDEYVGVPLDEPRNCANLIRRTAIEPWPIPPAQFHRLSSIEADAEQSIREHEAKVQEAGGLDLLILGLGKNGHIGFNEPGSAIDSIGRVLPLTETSINANREWFGGDFAPAKGVTTGVKLLLESRTILLLAFGSAKQAAVEAMVQGNVSPACPASFLQKHPDTHIFLDETAAVKLGKV